MAAWNGRLGGPVAPRDQGMAVQDWNMKESWTREVGVVPRLVLTLPIDMLLPG